MIWHWTSASCEIKVAVDVNGLVAIIHDPDSSRPVSAHVQEDETVSYFSIHWQKDQSGKDIYPNIGNSCGNGACSVGVDNTCICSTSVIESAIFETMPTREEIFSELSVGAFPIEMFDPNDYVLVEYGNDGVEVYQKRSAEATHFPTPAPVGACESNFIGFNSNLETGSTADWGCHGCATGSFQLYSPGFGDGGFAVSTSTGAITHSIQGSISECVSTGSTILFTHKVKIINEQDPAALVNCDDNCPYVRLRLQGPNNVNGWESKINGISNWIPGEWNTFEAHYTIPDRFPPPYSLFRVDYLAGVGGDIRLIIDDASIFLSTPAPSSAPSFSSIPSGAPSSFPSMASETPSVTPSLEPSEMPSEGPSNIHSANPSLSPSESAVPSTSPSTTCNGIFPPGTEKVLNNDNFDNGIPAGYSAFDKSEISSYDAGFNGTKAISLKVVTPPALGDYYLPAIRKSVWYANACITGGKSINVSFKAKLVNTTDMSEMSCNPAENDDCPEARFRIQTTTKSANDWLGMPLGFNSWTQGEWNTFDSTWPVPDIVVPTYNFFFLDITHGKRPRYEVGAVLLVIDDLKVVLEEGSGARRRLQEDLSDFNEDTSRDRRLQEEFSEFIEDTSEARGPRRSLQEELNKDTVFKVLDDNDNAVFFKNALFEAMIGGQYRVRNPPHFIDISEPTLRDAHYETDAVLDHLLYHENTAPFISKNLIQHFGISNPSPRYVQTVAQAFKVGVYVWTDGSNSISYGTGQRGDLAATAAAILLDREATSEVLNSDPSYGSVKEPIVKVIGFMRNMAFHRSEYGKLQEGIFAGGLGERIGQYAYEAPSVFSFFSPQFSPPGPLGKSLLLSPESQVLSADTAVSMTNGLFALINNGLNNCWGGFGPGRSIGCNYASGYLGYEHDGDTSNSTEVVNGLADLLTSGRLSQSSRSMIEQAYAHVNNNEDEQAALRVAQQLIVSSPEFHTNNIVQSSGIERTPAPPRESNGEPYKALVYIYLFGGLDSFYMLAPHSSCGSLHTDYMNIRGGAALTDQDANLITTTDQPCTTFNLIKELSVVKSMYDNEDALFFANMGHLDVPTTKDSWIADTKAQVFSHFHMQQEQQYVDAFRENVGTGVMGRLLDIMQGKNYTVGPSGINGNSKSLAGNPEIARNVDVIHHSGLKTFYERATSSSYDRQEMRDMFVLLNNRTKPESGLFGEHWSQSFVNAIDRSADLKAAIDAVSLTQGYPGYAGSRLSMAAKIIKSREARGVNRDAIYFTLGGHDSHFDMVKGVKKNLLDINLGLERFTAEIMDMQLHDSVTIIVASEFGRTLTLNGGDGTDHAWGGNYFMLGGAVKGGKIIGQYPDNFSGNDDSSCGRGRLIPTSPWERMWNGVAQWYGAEEGDLDYILPNRKRFDANTLWSKNDLFKV
eukprot:CAMPEP_0178928808 /NCGR_PEP_ID=MMETSP0786-20121207/20156_1 /TAXON_ID=186022 /ORGANISM="Thalassionema frauenfeldii, Strain CCMP 1798" /LENGTH=1403 /DNA_ID=CAMNT_0020604807 /DNA_START=186 /DNA_END=4393 /DNA_ORIENTATION=+